MGNTDESLLIQLHRFVHDILMEIAAGFRGVAGQGEAGQGLQVDIEGPADTGLQHASRPAGNTVFLAKLLNIPGGQDPAHPSLLDIDDPAAFHFHGPFGVIQILDGQVMELDKKIIEICRAAFENDVSKK